jgi:hypothetical protein
METEKKSRRKVRLKDAAFPHVKTREWIIDVVESDGSLWLLHENNQYGLQVKWEDLDWDWNVFGKRPMPRLRRKPLENRKGTTA